MDLSLTPSGLLVKLPDEIYNLAIKYGSGMMDSGELVYLAGALAICPWKNRDSIVVEIGAYHGVSTVYMAKVLQLLKKQMTILSIDPFERSRPDKLNPRGSYSAYLKTIKKSHFENTCLPLVAFSQDAAPVVADRVGLLIVDGNHQYQFVKQDLMLYGLKLLPGGIIFIDDYSSIYDGVVRATDEYLQQNNQLTILHKTYYVIVKREF